jgi:hypothetical protein
MIYTNEDLLSQTTFKILFLCYPYLDRYNIHARL